MKRIGLVALVLLMMTGLTWGDAASYQQVAATDTAKTANLGGASVLTIVNQGANAIYFRLFKQGEDPVAAVATATGGIYLASGASLEYPAGSYGSISVICAAGLTATVSLYMQ